MSDPTSGQVDLEQMDIDERREKIHNRVMLGLILLIGVAVAAVVGYLVNTSQAGEEVAQAKTEQVQVEKFNLAQQIATACADPSSGNLDSTTYDRLCTDARTIVREGPQGAQGIPGVQGPQGFQGVPGVPGADGAIGKTGGLGAEGTSGLNGFNGTDGAVGSNGTNGTDGKPGTDGVDGTDASIPDVYMLMLETKAYTCTRDATALTLSYTCEITILKTTAP